MKNIQKIIATAFVVASLFMGGQQVFALDQQTQEINPVFVQKIGVITQLFNLIEKEPRFKDVLQPFLDRVVAEFIADIEREFKNRGQYVKTTVAERNELRQELKDKKDESQQQSEDKVIEEIETKPYASIKNKWEVIVDFADAKKVTLYVYDIENKDQLITAITEKINAEFNLDLLQEDIVKVLEIEDGTDDE